MSNEERAKEFLSCLGNGKGRIMEEDEEPESFLPTKPKNSQVGHPTKQAKEYEKHLEEIA